MRIENVKIYGLSESIKASHYPMSTASIDVCGDITDADLKRAYSLGNTKIGAGHDNFMNGAIVQFDLQTSNKMWTELQRYHFIDFVSSQSTMYRISKFNLNEQYNEYVDPRIIEIMNELKDKYNQTNDKDDYLKLLYSNPCGFQLTARMTTNYRQLKTMYHQRKNHRLPEWREFCKWVETLPHSDWIIS